MGDGVGGVVLGIRDQEMQTIEKRGRVFIFGKYRSGN